MKSEKPKQKRVTLPLIDRIIKEVKIRYLDENNPEAATDLMELHEKLKKYRLMYPPSLGGNPPELTTVVNGKETTK